MNIKKIIGDYELFFSDLFFRLKKINIDIKNLPIIQLLYRVETEVEYKTLRDQIKEFCSEFVETQFNDRAVSILILEEPLKLEEGFTVSMIELPAPRPVHMYPSGFESIGVMLGKDLSDFKQRHKDVLTGVKEHGEFCQPAFVTFENDKTVKFYDTHLRDIVLLQGWKFERVSSKLCQEVSFQNALLEKN